LQLHVDSGPEAAAVMAAGIAVLSCEPDHTLEPIRAAAPSAFVSAGMPHGSVTSPQEAIRAGGRILERGASAVYCSHSAFFIEAMAREGIPVTGHVGLVPNRGSWTNFRAVGKSADEALKALRDVKDLENAGAACIEVEVIPVELADYITRHTHRITMCIGCGDACDTQYLFSSDVLGTHQGGHTARRIGPGGITLTERGTGTNTRYINNIAMEAEDFCDSLLVTEVFTPAGHWSSYPSHRHDEDNFPRITNLEETYYHRLNPADGFGIQWVYTGDGSLDEPMAVSDGDVVLVPRGHHPCGAPYGFEMYYLNVMAGPQRKWRFVPAPEVEWILNRDEKEKS
jgi:ketopantoate hydroxymethyltransferase